MKIRTNILVLAIAVMFAFSCNYGQKNEQPMKPHKNKSAKDILGNPDYLAISYGGYRENTRDIQPTIDELIEDLKILYAMGIRIVRTYNVHLPHASNVLKAIKQLKQKDQKFEMYVMLGAWIDCENAWTDLPPNHDNESIRNASEIDIAATLAAQYPDIVKIIAVGNEAMVRWAANYYVQPGVILKWVNYLQDLKKSEKLPQDLWITSSDDFSSWGGGDPSYHTPDLEALIKAVDYISMHTYPMHNSHYNPEFWLVPKNEWDHSPSEKIEAAMFRARDFAIAQYEKVKNFVDKLGVDKPIHIGETGWATVSNQQYGADGSKAADEFKSGRYYNLLREWSKESKIACFYFEAFDEPWKDADNPLGSENHFGLINVKGQAKFALWDLVDKGVFEGLTRNGLEITKTYSGDIKLLMKDVNLPPIEYNMMAYKG